MNEENNQNTSINKDSDNVVNALHKGGSLPTLRTYQGDVAEFIKEKNESVTSIAVKEKEKKREEEREQSIAESKRSAGFRINFVAIVLSLLLILAGSFTVFFVMKFLQRDEPVVTLKQEIIPYNSEVSLANITKETLSSEIRKISSRNGVTAIRVSDINGNVINTSNSFFSFLGINPPSTISRSLGQEFFLGSINTGENIDYFIILSVDDFGRAFSGMLEWESSLRQDFSFLINKNKPEELTDLDVEAVALDPEWKDVIIKNKDTRAFVDSKNEYLAYTFLDKNTVLVSSGISSIGEISSIFASRSVIR